MKKILSLVLALALVLSVSGVAFAAEITTSGGTGTVEVQYKINKGFKVVIPAGPVDILENASDQKVEAQDVVIDTGETLKVTVSSQESWKLKNGAQEIAYKLEAGTMASDTNPTAAILEVAAGTATGEVTLNFSVTGSLPKVSGTYTDTLTFTATVAGSEAA